MAMCWGSSKLCESHGVTPKRPYHDWWDPTTFFRSCLDCLGIWTLVDSTHKRCSPATKTRCCSNGVCRLIWENALVDFVDGLTDVQAKQKPILFNRKSSYHAVGLSWGLRSTEQVNRAQGKFCKWANVRFGLRLGSGQNKSRTPTPEPHGCIASSEEALCFINLTWNPERASPKGDSFKWLLECQVDLGSNWHTVLVAQITRPHPHPVLDILRRKCLSERNEKKGKSWTRNWTLF